MITIEEARTLYGNAESAHDFDHVLRVLAIAERLAIQENANLEVIRAAALLHDIARADEDRLPGSDHAQIGADRARRILLDRGATISLANAVADTIAAHRFRSDRRPETLEAKILFDADKLDSIGAIGIARAYAVSGALNQRLYGPVSSDAVATRDQRNSHHSAVAEFAVKLSKVRELMYTETARQIAEERHQYMVEFFRRLEQEVRGEL